MTYSKEQIRRFMEEKSEPIVEEFIETLGIERFGPDYNRISREQRYWLHTTGKTEGIDKHNIRPRLEER